MLEAGVSDRYQVIIAITAAMLFSFIVFLLKWLTLDGAMAASVFGGISFGLGGWGIAGLILLFFVTSTLLTSNSIVVIKATAQAFAERKRRDGIQVWANGFWVALWVMIWFIFHNDLFLLAAAGAISTATADTWATEMGSYKFGGNTYLVTNFKRVKAGTEGGVSLQGTFAALMGSLMIAGASIIFLSIPWYVALLVVFLPGFLGCMVDSYFGATFQQDQEQSAAKESPFEIRLDNNFVNWAASGIGSLAALIINSVLLL